jgi:hypothetical protein
MIQAVVYLWKTDDDTSSGVFVKNYDDTSSGVFVKKKYSV